MADPLSFAASITALIAATGTVIAYLRDLRDSDEQRQSLHDEVTSLWAVLCHLKETIRRTSPTTADSGPLATLHQPGGVIEQCHKVIGELQSRLQPRKNMSSQVLHKLHWSFAKDEVQRRIDQLHRFQTTINGALAQASLSLSEAILDHSIVSRSLLEVQEAQAIRNWLSPSNSFAQQIAFSSSYCPGTLTSFLHSRAFLQWSSKPKEILWCRGAPGTGKTYLASTAANHLRATWPKALVLIAHCQYDDPACQKLGNIVGDLLRQSLQDQEIPQRLFQAYRAAMASGTGIPLESALDILTEEIGTHGKAFVIVDAVDEINQANERKQLLDLIVSRRIGANFLITSRPLEDIRSCLEPAGHVCDGCQVGSPEPISKHFPELHRCFGGCDFDLCQGCYDSGLRCSDLKHTGLMRLTKHNYRYHVWARPEDLERYVEWRIRSDAVIGSFVGSRPSLGTELINAALSQSEATGFLFLLVRLLIDSLGSCLTAKQFKKTIEKLPSTLNSAYDSTIDRIDQQHSQWSEIAYETMAWMSFAKRPLHVEEIEHAIAIVVESQEFDVDDIVPGRKLVDLCCGLVMMDDSKRFRFVHPTVEDHIKIVLRDRLPEVETIVTRKCLTYLQLKHLESGPCTDKEELETRLSNFPLMRYCSWYWALHLQDVQDDQVHALAEKILAEDRYWRSALQTHEYLLPDNIVQTFDFSVLHYVAEVGAIGFLEDLIQRNAQDINAQDINANIKLITPLMLSAYGNHSLCVAELLKLGANPNLQDCRGKTALHLAAEKGHLQTVNVLVGAASVDLNLLDDEGNSALTRAITWEHGEVAERILEAGADINARAGSGYTALAEAIYHKSQSSILKALLLRPELDTTIFSAGFSPLMIAAAYGDLETNKKLLQMPGMDINAQSAFSEQTVLMTAIGNLHVDVALLLLQQEDIKLDIPCKYAAVSNERTRRGWTALFYAVNLGNDTLFDALLDKGASSDIVTEDFSTPLLIAASMNHGRMLARLIQLREDTGLKQQSGAPHAELCTPPSAAGSRRAPHQLSDFRRGELSTALHYAVDWGNLEMASLLVQHGASLDQRDARNVFTVVDYALYWNNLEILDLFLRAEPENPLLLQRGLAEKKPPDEGRAA